MNVVHLVSMSAISGRGVFVPVLVYMHRLGDTLQELYVQ